MTSSQIRQSFLDFFKSKQHTIVPSSSLMPDSPNLLFTNAGMNQFVPIFLGQTKCPYTPGRAADTQKCIRAGGKHNDLDDVGLDTYHHTFFEMLGNWSFGDYFKREAIDWAWELVVKAWGFPPDRLYATVFCPYLGEPGWEAKWRTEMEQVLVLAMTSPDFIPPNPDASPFEIADLEAAMYWAKKFQTVGLDPKVHIIPGNKKDNFWMMGETGPCGPCSELHFDLTPAGNTRGKLVNQGSAQCIEIWNLVFIQFNANPDGTFTPLPARHVDTGMGLDRVTSFIQGTKGFTDFANPKISNYETDAFRPIFDAIERLSGRKYTSTLPKPGSTGDTEQEKIDIAFRVIADHIRTLGFAITDGIQPGNTDRNYVLRRILRRAVRYGRTLGFHEPFFYKLVDVLADTMGDVFPEIHARKKHVQEVIQREEVAFNKTLDRGISMFTDEADAIKEYADFLTHVPKQAVSLERELEVLISRGKITQADGDTLFKKVHELTGAHDSDWDREIMTAKEEPVSDADALELSFSLQWREQWSSLTQGLHDVVQEWAGENYDHDFLCQNLHRFKDGLARVLVEVARESEQLRVFPTPLAFRLYDTYGFPLDLTELMARERGLTVDTAGFEKLMEEQRARARAAQKKEIITVSVGFAGGEYVQVVTNFVGYDRFHADAKVQKVAVISNKPAVILDDSPCYAEMGGQVGDAGMLTAGNRSWRILDTRKSDTTFLHFIAEAESTALPEAGLKVSVSVDAARRNAIQRHHTVTHLLHWALHEVVSKEASQKGSFVGPDKLTFDFNSAPLSPSQVAEIEKLVNEKILENEPVHYVPDVAYADVKSRKDVMQFFGDKYGDTVRVVQIGGHAAKLDGYSMELCGGTHTRATGEIGLFRIVSENAIAAGVRRIEAIAGLTAFDAMKLDRELIKTVAGKVNSPIHELEKKIEALLAQQKELEKQVKTAMQRNASNAASELLGSAQTVNGIPLITHNLGAADGDLLQAIADALKGRFKGVAVLGGCSNNAVTLVATVSPDFTAKMQAGKIIQQIAPIVGGKGGGKPDNARGGGKDVTKLDEALAKAAELLK